MIALPIDNIKHQFLEILTSQHLVVEAETGSGKSTKLPIWASSQGRVLVIEPRRIACTSLAEFLAKQLDTPLGTKVGYAIKLEAKMQADSEIVFVTPGVALRWFAQDELSDFDIVLVDEFHERRWDTDLLVALLKEKARHRLIITSATIEGDRLAKYVAAQRLVASGRQYKVAVTYNSRDSHHLPDPKNLVTNVTEMVKEKYQQCHGDILIFLPGRKEIQLCAQALGYLDDIEVVALHASVSDTERVKALTPQPRKKIVLATNVAETSLTIPNITLVIDSGLERRTLQRNNRTVLSLKNISKASADQRKGRAGRVMDGECIRLYGEHAPLERVTPAEMLREELSEAMLASACCGFQLSELTFLEALPEPSLQRAMQILQQMEALTSDGVVTEHGKRIYPLPIDILYADLITRISTKQEREAMIDLSAALSVPAALYNLPKSEDKLEKLALWEPNACDGEVLIRIVRGESCESITVDADAVKEAKGIAQQVRSAFELPDLDAASRFRRGPFLQAVASLHPELVYVRRQRRREALANGHVEMLPARSSRFADKDEAAIILDQHSLPGRGVKQTLNLATVMLPIPLSFIEELALGEWVQGETLVEDGKLFTQMTLTYAGRTIATREVSAQGELLYKPLLDAVLRGEILPGFANKRSQDIAYWRLYVELGLSDAVSDHQGITFESWFTALLKDLDISEAEELQLFDQDELKFDGVPYWEYQDFVERYPYMLHLGDLQLSVEYMPSKKLVHVSYQSGLRKLPPKRWELPKWPGWRIQFKKASRVIDIR